MIYEQNNYNYLLGLKGFSDVMLANHFSLYGGYVKNVNLIVELSKTVKANSPEYNELKRRFGWEWNGMRMHELYFGNLSKEKQNFDKKSKLFRDIETRFGSYDKWLEDFKATGTIRGVGWAMFVKDTETGSLMNIWVGEHNDGHLCNQNVLLVMDAWEHAYITDYGIKRADYINVFIKNINWKKVEERFELL